MHQVKNIQTIYKNASTLNLVNHIDFIKIFLAESFLLFINAVNCTQSHSLDRSTTFSVRYLSYYRVDRLLAMCRCFLS